MPNRYVSRWVNGLEVLQVTTADAAKPGNEYPHNQISGLIILLPTKPLQDQVMDQRSEGDPATKAEPDQVRQG